MEIRHLLLEDMPQLAALYRCFWDEDSDVEKMKRQWKLLEHQGSHILLGAVENDQLVGSAMGVICQEFYGDCRPFLVLENMVVSPDWRKKGIGRALLNRMEKEAGLQNCTQIILVTEKSRRDACSFYEACGFSQENTGYKKKL